MIKIQIPEILFSIFMIVRGGNYKHKRPNGHLRSSEEPPYNYGVIGIRTIRRVQ